MGSFLSIFVSLLLFCLVHGIETSGGKKSENTIDRESGVLGSLIFPRVFDVLTVDGLETPIQFRATTYFNIAAWNAWCNYHPTAADIFNRTRFKRPAKEHTRENKNVAVLYALFRLYTESPVSFGGESGIPVYRELLKEQGLNPDDLSTDLTTAVGIGNRAGFDTAKLMAIDNWNAEGELTNTQSHYAQSFSDYSGYVPKNDPWKIKFPFKWQPLLESNGRGFYFRQESVVPFAGSTIAFSMTKDEVKRRKVKSPYRRGSAPVGRALKSDIRTLKKNAMDVFRTSAELTEEQRTLAEYFDNKGKSFRTKEMPEAIPGIATVLRFGILGPVNDWNLDEDMIYGLGTAIATMDSMVTAWKEKRRVDATRPTDQTMKFLFGDKKFKVYGGPGKKPVMIKASEWQPYIRTMPHAEFPSGSSCTCSAVVEHALLNSPEGRDDLPFTFTVPKGSSKFYPGQLPEKDVTIKIDRLSDWAKLCGQSRLWAGVHFAPSIKAGEDLCRGIGASSHDFAEKLAVGQLDPKWLSWLPENVEKFWEED